MQENRNEIRRLMIAINRIDELYYRALRTLKVKDNAFVLFYAVSDGKAHTQKKICDEWLIPRTTLNTIVKEYVNAGYIQLAAQGNKEKEIILTDRGKDFASEILTPIFSAEEKAMNPLYGKGLVEQIEKFTERLDIEFRKLNENDNKDDGKSYDENRKGQ